MNKWELAQREELKFWTIQRYDIIKSYKNIYSVFIDFLLPIDKTSRAIDIGCGAIPFSLMFNFKNLTLMDSLIDKYLQLPDSKSTIKSNLNDKIFLLNSNIETCDTVCKYDIVLFLNVLDHVNDVDVSLDSVYKLCKLNRYILLYTDLRTNATNCHPTIVNLSMLKNFEINNNLKLIYEKIDHNIESGMQGYWAIYEK